MGQFVQPAKGRYHGYRWTILSVRCSHLHAPASGQHPSLLVIDRLRLLPTFLSSYAPIHGAKSESNIQLREARFRPQANPTKASRTLFPVKLFRRGVRCMSTAKRRLYMDLLKMLNVSFQPSVSFLQTNSSHSFTCAESCCPDFFPPFHSLQCWPLLPSLHLS